MEFNSYEILVMRRRLPDPRMLRVVSRSVFLVLVLVTLLWNGIVRRAFSLDSNADDVGTFGFVSGQIDARFLDVIFQDLCNEGLVKKGDKAVVVISRIGAVIGDSRILNANEADLVLESDLARGSTFPNGTVDFAFYLGLEDVTSVDRVVKVGGIVVSQFGRSSLPLRRLNYRVVFLRQYKSTIIAMRKMSLVEQHQRREVCCRWNRATKKLHWRGLKVYYLRRRKSSWQNWKGRIREGFKDESLKCYQHRGFFEVGSYDNKKGSKVEWFKENYPIRNQEFEFHGIGNQPRAGLAGWPVSPIHASNWFIRNVKEDDIFAMRAKISRAGYD